MNTGEKTGIVMTVFAILYGVATLNMGAASVGNKYEPMVFPLMLVTLIIICSLSLFILERRKRLAMEAKDTGPKKEKKPFELTYETKMIIWMCVVSILYGLLFDRIGYVLSTTFFMGGLLFAFNDGMKKWLTNTLLSVGFSVIIYYLFSQIFYIPLPPLPYFNI